MVTRYNPSLRRELRYQAIPIIPSRATESLLNWLKRTGRLKPREIDSTQEDEVLEELEEIMGTSISGLDEELA
jgi:hypothetical protein